MDRDRREGENVVVRGGEKGGRKERKKEGRKGG